MSVRQLGVRADAALLLWAPSLALLAVGLVTAFERWRWESICVRICGPFLDAGWPPAAIDSFRRAMDWHMPLGVAAVAALVLLALLAGLHSGRTQRAG